jgi:hypothetical protein
MILQKNSAELTALALLFQMDVNWIWNLVNEITRDCRPTDSQTVSPSAREDEEL